MFPEKTQRGLIIIGVLACMGASASAVLSNIYAPETTQEAVSRIADQLETEQLPNGAWPSRGAAGSGDFTGSMAAGLGDAYWMTCASRYKTAAELAGTWILDNTDGCSLYYDDAYALMQLSQIDCNPGDNTWRTALEAFYDCVEIQPAAPEYDNKFGTALVIAELEVTQGIPWVVMDVAYYTVVAYYVDADEKEIWRDELIRLLEACNAPNSQQIFMLGVATWALAQTGDMDGTGGFTVGSSLSGYGEATTLAELPPLLASYQVPPSDALFHDHFMTIYDAPNPTFSGYTETNIYAAMGLSASTHFAGFDYRSEMDRLWAVNMQPVDDDGNVDYDAIEIPPTGDEEKYYHYAGEYLQYLAATRLPGDINLDDTVDLDDVSFLAGQWLESGCGCNRADLNRDRVVDFSDFAVLASGWLLSR